MAQHGAPAGLRQRAAAWSIDAACITPPALLLAWPWLLPAAGRWHARFESLMHDTGAALATAIVDGVPLPMLTLSMSHDPRLAEAVRALHLASWSLLLPALLSLAAVGALWNVAGEHSRWQGSGGKRVLGLRVVDAAGRRPGLARSLWRHLAGAASWATLNIGHAMAAGEPRHLALHDRISRTRVVADAGTDAPLPRPMRAWLALLAVAATAIVAWATATASRMMEAALLDALY
ncbi:RDD family protein [Novilysobacter arseniciresistens]|uniref:RDD family protein n=1 Tax=Novilysobacter arseniciresistens TaxID=1385522 RepID=UPI00068BB6BD|nr:RDD family protein [Lysobacter arseniciresistens]